MSPRDRRAVLWGAVLIGLAVLYRMVLTPVVDRWGEARADAATQSAMLTQLEDKLEKRGRIRDRIEQRYGAGVKRPLLTVDEARIAFPRSVQEAIRRGQGSARQVEVQGLRKLRDLPGVELLSLRVWVSFEAEAIDGVFKELTRADVPVVIESVSLKMTKPGQRDKWEATLVVSTPARQDGGAS